MCNSDCQPEPTSIRRIVGKYGATGIVVLVSLATFMSRWWLRTDYLLLFDVLQSAAAMSYYDVSLDMPQPPGAPVYAGLLRLAGLLHCSPEHTVLLASSVFDAAAVVLIFYVAASAISRRAGYLSALMYLLSPLACHSATIGLTFGMDACLSAAVGLLVLKLWQWPSRVKAFLLGVLLGLALGARVNANWASAALLPLAVLGLWRAPRSWTRPFLGGLALTVALWALPAVLLGGRDSGYIQSVVTFYSRYTWQPSALATALADGLSQGVSALARTLASYVIYMAKALGAGMVLLPLAVIPARASFGFSERIPWSFVLVWVIPPLLLPAVGSHHVDEYVAVSFPPLLLVTSVGLLRGSSVMRSLLAVIRIPRCDTGDRLEGAFAVSHVLVLCVANAAVLSLLISLDSTNSRNLGGRFLTSIRAQLRKPGKAFGREDLALGFLDTLDRQCGDQKALIITKSRYEFLFLSLHASKHACLHVASREKGILTQLAEDHIYETQELPADESLRLPGDIDVVFAPDTLAGRNFEVPFDASDSGLYPHELWALRNTRLYRTDACELELRHAEGEFSLAISRKGEHAGGTPPGGVGARVVQGTGDAG